MGIVDHLTNKAYGFPSRGSFRRIEPVALACIHITGNSRTAAYTDQHAAAKAERDYANRTGSDGPSAHYYVARDGWDIQAVDPIRHAAWSNGDVLSPTTTNTGIRRVLAMRDRGYNANEAYWLEIECVGYGTKYPITVAQRVFCAQRIAAMSLANDLPINVETVHAHRWLNGVNRRNCPTSGDTDAFIIDVVIRANAILKVSSPVRSFPVFERRTYVPVAANARLYDNSDLAENSSTIVIQPARELVYVGSFSSSVGIVAYEPPTADANVSSTAMFVRRSSLGAFRFVDEFDKGAATRAYNDGVEAASIAAKSARR